MKANKLTAILHAKGWTLEEFLAYVSMGRDWYYKHSNGGKMYNLLVLAVNGVSEK